LSGLGVQAGGDWNVTLTAGNRILVKDQTTGANNGIYLAAAGAWTRSLDANTYDELLSAYLFVLDGVTLAGSAWVNTNLPGGTLGVTAITFVRFSNTAVYSAGTGLTLTNYVFSITPVGTAGTYGSASSVPVFVTNASGQVSSVTNTPIAIANTQVSGLGTMSTQNANAVAITGGSIDGTTIGGSTAAAITGTIVTANTYFSGAGTNLTGTASGLSIGGNAATATTATSATNATNLSGGAAGSVPYQSAPSTTIFLAAGSNGQVLTLASGVPSWATPTTGTVTSVGTAGTVNGLTLTGGTITTSGTITLGGTLDLSAPPTIGNTTPNTGRFTTLTVDDNSTFGTSNSDTINFVGRINSDFDPATDNTYDLGRVGHEWRNLYIDGTANIDSLIADTADINAGTIDNTSIGLTTAAAGYFTTLSLTSTLSVNGSTGTNGQVLQSNGSSAPTWVTPTSYATVTDDTTTAATRYPLFADQTTGNLTTEFVSSTKLQFNPSTGVFTSTSFSGAGTGLTGTATSLSIGGTAATATSAASATKATNIAGGVANQIPYQTGVDATSFITAPTTASTALTWNGSAFTWAAPTGGLTISDDTTTNSTRYLTFTSATTGTITTQNVSSTKLQFNPSTGAFSVVGQLNADNITIDGNTISSTNTNGNIEIDPNGTGAINLVGPVTSSGTASYLLKTIRYLTSGTAATYDTPDYVRAIYVECVGGGAGGGGVDGQGAGTGVGGGGGSGGGYVAKLITSPSASYTYTIGAGGAGGASGVNNGSSGSNTTFTDGTITLNGNGGNGGLGLLGSASNANYQGAAGGDGSGGDIVIGGQRAGPRSRGNFAQYFGGFGGGSVFGQGDGGAGGTNAAGEAAVRYGCGGGGGGSDGTSSNYAGGAGFQGVIRITEYY
jgi:hypothetical protein